MRVDCRPRFGTTSTTKVKESFPESENTAISLIQIGFSRGKLMLGRFLTTVGAALLLATAGTSMASAQNYDGSGVVKFGVFGQGMFLNIDQSLPAIASGSPGGISGGFSAGYDLTLHRHLLLGIEADGSFGDVGDQVGFTDYGMDYLFTVRGRLGFYAHPGWLLYGTAGVGFLGLEASQPGRGSKSAQSLTGFVGGAGTEIEWSPHFLMFAEYLYGDYGETTFALPQGTGLPVQDHSADVDSHLFRVGVKFKIGHDYAHDTYLHPDDYRNREPLK
jgi:opacity protein-like surface antigen